MNPSPPGPNPTIVVPLSTLVAMTIEHFVKLESRLVKSADGTEIYTDAAGNRSPSVPTIVMIPGFSMIGAAFNAIFEDPKWLSNAFLVRYDPRGHGKSGKPVTDEAWESQRMSEDFEAVCKEFGVTKAFVMGWSLGASHFVDIVNYNTSVTISGFINVEGTIYLSPAIIFRIAAPTSLVLLGDLTQTTDVDAFQQATLRFISWLSDHLSPDLSRTLLEGVILVPRAVAGKLTARTQDPEKMLQQARAGELEALVITSEKDKLLNPDGVREVYEESGWKKYVLRHIKDADHMPWLSKPDEFREIMLGWMKERHR